MGCVWVCILTQKILELYIVSVSTVSSLKPHLPSILPPHFSDNVHLQRCQCVYYVCISGRSVTHTHTHTGKTRKLKVTSRQTLSIFHFQKSGGHRQNTVTHCQSRKRYPQLLCCLGNVKKKKRVIGLLRNNCNTSSYMVGGMCT